MGEEKRGTSLSRACLIRFAHPQTPLPSKPFRETPRLIRTFLQESDEREPDYRKELLRTDNERNHPVQVESAGSIDQSLVGVIWRINNKERAKKNEYKDDRAIWPWGRRELCR